MEKEYYEEMLEQEAINKYLNMIANDYNGELAKTFQEKYINKEKEIERLNKLKERYQLEKEIYKTRNQKAIEYIICGLRGDIENDRAYCDENALLDILKGEDK